MKKVISTTSAPAAIGPYSQAVETGNMIFLSGQLPIDPKTGIMPEGIKAQTRQSFANIKAILAEAGYSVEHIVKTTVLLADMSLFGNSLTANADRDGNTDPNCSAYISFISPKRDISANSTVVFTICSTE